MEASALTHASRRGLLARRSPLLKLQGDEHLIAMARAGNPGAFEAIVDRYQGRLLGFSRQMLGSTEDAEDVLQEVFVNAYRAMLADEREINLRPWLYRIARNRCLNHLRKPTADAQESMDMVPEVEAASTAEKVHNREEFRQLLTDVGKLPETQRSALLLREMDAMSYEEIAQAMETSVPSVKSLLVRARISLAEASQARQLTCGEVRLDLAEAAEGLRKLSGPVRRHVRDCEECKDFRSQLRSNDKVLAALVPVGPLVALKGFIASKLGLGGAGSGGAATATGAGGAGAVGGVGAALGGGGGAAGGLGSLGGAVGGAIGTKAVAGVVTAAVLTAGAVEVKQQTEPTPVSPPAQTSTIAKQSPSLAVAPQSAVAAPVPLEAAEVEPAPVPAPVEPAPVEAEVPEEVVAEPPVTEEVTGSGGVEAPEATAEEQAAAKIDGATPSAGTAGAPVGAGTGTVVVTVGGSGSTPVTAAPPVETAPPPPPPPAESPAAVEESPPAPSGGGEVPPAEG
ncbi:MAG TPA: RNA polymerase sigma factor [Solirubrobacterales bacterium]|nr:RNA polymerase sigma factor [Solirubrobacterales bacterium]